jgi:hypothetical protein
MFSFIGIPYAVPLLGTDRWTHSKPMTNLAECHEGTFKAHSQNVVSAIYTFVANLAECHEGTYKFNSQNVVSLYNLSFNVQLRVIIL